ncbi:MAG TPA: SUF system NifU family Fe-S cluster assembly protein [Woeseiaceae bacterium]|nr:SUF system NifU family Fe-S cluster assembly protein [Woeseiaceae bacterium]
MSRLSDDLRELYRELILDHARNPRHFGCIEGATHSAEGINPLCGDKLRMYFRVDENGRIEDARFEGSGCAISVASASLLTDTVIGQTTERALAYFAAMVRRLASRGEPAESEAGLDLGKLEALEGVKEFPTRVKCATLAWHALDSALNGRGSTVSTE